jgi:hypothetical protein
VLGAFLVICLITHENDDADIAGLAGLGQRAPLLAFALTLSMASLAGIPPLAGFFGKFLLLKAVVEQAGADPAYWLLLFVAIIGVVISLYYYFGVVRAMYWGTTPALTNPVPSASDARCHLFLRSRHVVSRSVPRRIAQRRTPSGAGAVSLEILGKRKGCDRDSWIPIPIPTPTQIVPLCLSEASVVQNKGLPCSLVEPRITRIRRIKSQRPPFSPISPLPSVPIRAIRGQKVFACSLWFTTEIRNPKFETRSPKLETTDRWFRTSPANCFSREIPPSANSWVL